MKSTYKLIFNTLLYSLLLSSITKAQNIVLLQQGSPTSIRGLSVVNDKTAWVSGSNGYIAITNNGGKTWDWQQVKGYEKSEFRDIEAFSNKEAVIMSSGTPALVLKTIDGGKSWQEKYRKTDTSYFFDAMDFDNNQRGYILGDPINNKFLLMETKDDGETWAEVKNTPDALSGEAAFAASGTCLRVKDGDIKIVSGGKSSRMITLKSRSEVWDYVNLPITHTKASQGAFSLVVKKNGGIIVGGDYANDKKTDSVSTIYTLHPHTLFHAPQKGPAGFQSCVEYIKGDIFLSTGTPGSNITIDGGKNWTKIDGTSFNVCGKAKHGKLVLLAGNGGKIAIFKM
ncbi:MAG: oxidoreductase [Mucilaginibacter sp.]|nr:oxidoreductase [Mucilaginibacter sp.]